jgi:hypothetical protein
MLLAEEATEERLAAMSLEGVRVLVLFAHGATRRVDRTVEDGTEDSENLIERPATLVLSPSDGHDGLLGPDEVEQIAWPGLVVLSACGAAVGPARYGDDGIQHLGGVFIRGGAKVVLLTRADLEVASTAALTAAFLENLVQRSLAPARALQEARRSVAATANWEHPFYHSMLQVVGDGHHPVFEGQPGAGNDSRGRDDGADRSSQIHVLEVLLGLSGLLLLVGVSLWIIRRARR